MKKNIKNQKGIALIWLFFLIAILIVSSGSLFAVTIHEAKLINIDQSRDKAFYLAEAGVDQMITELRAAVGTLPTTTTGSAGSSAGTFNVTYCSPATTVCTSDPTISLVTSTGTAGGMSKTVSVVVSTTGSIPAGVRAALSAVGDLTLLGSIVIDGRDHDSSGNPISGSGGAGKFGVSSGGSVTIGGSATVGGNGDPPSATENTFNTEENATVNVFATPEEALGLAPGSLDSYKSATPPVAPFSGIHYVTEDWTGANLGDASNPSTGILIIHNDDGDAHLKNLQGYFQGIIITDRLTHINGNAEILGAVILQHQNGNTVGNGNAHVKFSSTILENLQTSGGGYTVLSWKDAQNG